MKNNKKTIWASALALLVCCTLLLGSTFAWFTDSATNTGNSITSGKFDVRFFGVKLDGGTWKEINPIEKDALIDDVNWEPGQYGAAIIGVSNWHNNLAAKIDVDFTITDGADDLANALWYKITPIKTNLATAESAGIYDMLEFANADVRPAKEGDYGVKTMTGIVDETNEIILSPNTPEDDGNIYCFYLIEYGMYTDAGNEYQNKTFGMDIKINAGQAVYEEDAFGNSNYDENAEYEA